MLRRERAASWIREAHCIMSTVFCHGWLCRYRLAVLRSHAAGRGPEYLWARGLLRAGKDAKPVGGWPCKSEVTMTPQRRKRLYLVLGIVAGVGVATALALSAFRQNVTFYFIPTRGGRGRGAR